MIRSNSVWRLRRSAVASVACLLVFFAVALDSQGASLPIGLAESQGWSDLNVGSIDTGGYTAGSFSFSAVASGAGILEIGSQYGPNLEGSHYGGTGDLGGLFSATVDVSGVLIDNSGAVTNGGTLTITLNGSQPGIGGGLAADYGFSDGGGLNDVLLTGTVKEVLIGATGDNTLDVLFDITGGALQTVNNSDPSGVLDGIPFSDIGLGLLRFKGGGIPLVSDWSTDFSLAGATLDTFGIPEPTTFALLLVGTVALVNRRR